MIERFIGPSVEWLSELWPGYKTQVVAVIGIGMMICEMSNYFWQFGHSFDMVTWNMVPMSASLTIAIRKYKEMKDKVKEIK